jgi:23S rRNA pseudouridine2605 synthase
MDDNKIRLNKHLALQLGVSRREADELIEKGNVAIDGQTAILGQRIDPSAIIEVKGEAIATDAAIRLVLFNKPVGYVCSRKAQGENPTIYDLLPSDMRALKPVGRLDKNSSGLLLLTNDGDLAHSMTHPSFKKVKVYQVQLDHALEPLHQQMISDHGVQLEDGVSQFLIARIDDTPTYEITMHEGRNRQIRRTFAALGYEVTKLHRTQFGQYVLSDIQPGKTRPI